MLKTLLLFLIPLQLFCQDDNWDVYMASYEKGPGSNVINMSAKRNAPNKELSFILVTGVSFDGCSTDGLPTKNQFPDLYTIADSIEKIVTTNTKSIHAGTFTYQCERLDYYYVKDTNGISANLQKCYISTFPKYRPYINIKEDKTWEAYLGFLYPNEETLEYMGNQKIVLKLQEAGDKLEKPRKVDHWLYFAAEADRNCILAYIKANHFTIESKEIDKSLEKSFKLQISRTDKVDLPTINQVTLDLRKDVLKCNGDYDGWETFVVK